MARQGVARYGRARLGKARGQDGNRNHPAQFFILVRYSYGLMRPANENLAIRSLDRKDDASSTRSESLPLLQHRCIRDTRAATLLRNGSELSATLKRDVGTAA